jgi:hypothetical protein
LDPVNSALNKTKIEDVLAVTRHGRIFEVSFRILMAILRL